MDTWIYTLAIIAAVIAALAGTLLVAKNPADKNYGSAKRRITNLTIIYIVVAIISLLGFVLYLFR